jgi:hypothetical protein
VKITHRNPATSWFRVPQSAVVEPAYQAEVDRSTAHGERGYRLRQQRLANAEARLAKAQKCRNRTPARKLAELMAVVELRRAELEEYRRMMVAVAASAEHRGTRSFRPVPPVRGIPS